MITLITILRMYVLQLVELIIAAFLNANWWNFELYIRPDFYLLSKHEKFNTITDINALNLYVFFLNMCIWNSDEVMQPLFWWNQFVRSVQPSNISYIIIVTATWCADFCSVFLNFMRSSKKLLLGIYWTPNEYMNLSSINCSYLQIIEDITKWI